MAVEVGAILEGKVTGVKKFGAFVLLPGGETEMCIRDSYNIFIMEEVHTILSAGAGGSTKLVEPGGRIQRIFNYKYPAEYIKGFDEMLALSLIHI